MRCVRLGALALAAAFLAAAPARAVDKEAVNAAIEKGVKSLRALQLSNGTWVGDQIGMTALIGLTLLECDVPADDPALRKAAAAIRSAAVTTDQTYSIALTIMFLDRLGEPVDVALIDSLTVRLLGGQSLMGAWSYKCPAPPPEEQRRLATQVELRAERGPDKDAAKVEPGKRKAEDLPKEILAQLEVVRRQRAAGQGLDFRVDDNSNTQFAILGLWVARRYGLPVDGALEAAERTFRASVNPDGGWSYIVKDQPAPVLPGAPFMPGLASTPAMTCAGLLGIGLAYGAWNESALRTEPKPKEPGKPGPAPVKPQDPSKDKVVQGAFRLLGVWVDAMGHPPGKAPQINRASGKFYYFLWSLERVSVAYGVDTIGKTNWYDWGADILLANQGADGGWNNGDFRGGPDTCFALLVLKRANFAKDLTRVLTSQMKDGLQLTLRQGGVGGGDLAKKGRKPFFEGPAEGPADRGPAAADGPAARLGERFAAATGAAQDDLLRQLRDGKGGEYTAALASAIPRLEGEALKKARDALAERMARMTSETLGGKLRDDAAEVRRAAALAVAMKDDKAHAFDLIDLLEDPEARVVHAAHAALKSLTDDKVDFGPKKDATREERGRAIVAWKEWWRKRLREK
jgi:hypothetical protein